MPGKETLYDILGVDRDATEGDIRRAYRKYQSQMQDPTVPPDPRRAVLVQEAYGILVDPGRRAVYDQELRSPRAVIERARSNRGAWLGGGMAIVVVLSAGYFWMQPPPPEPQRSHQELSTVASLAIGRVHTIGLDGQYTAQGLAFTTDSGVMVTVCDDLVPNAELVVKFGPRQIPGRVMEVNAPMGLCKLQVAGGGSWPLMVTAVPQRPGARVYGADVNVKGEVTLLGGSIRRVVDAPNGRRIETTIALRPELRGSPMLDADGRAVAIAVNGAGAGSAPAYVTLPVGWLEPRPPPPPPPPRDLSEEPAPSAAAPRVRPNPGFKSHDITPERKERIEKAFRPPLTVPDDL